MRWICTQVCDEIRLTGILQELEAVVPVPIEHVVVANECAFRNPSFGSCPLCFSSFSRPGPGYCVSHARGFGPTAAAAAALHQQLQRGALPAKPHCAKAHCENPLLNASSCYILLYPGRHSDRFWKALHPKDLEACS